MYKKKNMYIQNKFSNMTNILILLCIIFRQICNKYRELVDNYVNQDTGVTNKTSSSKIFTKTLTEIIYLKV